MSLLVPFGFRDGQLYEPRQVSNGKACGCTCPGCQHPLVAKQNAQTPHFAHAPGDACKNGLETAIHLAAKQLISERMELSIPAVTLQFPGGYGVKKSTQELYVSNLKTLSEVRIEPWFNGFRPDIVVVELDRAREILIEIAVTYFVEEPKLTQIKNHGLHAIEIDVSAAREKMDFFLLKKFLFDVPSLGVWLHHPRAAELEQESLSKREREWKAKEQAQSNRFENYRLLNPREQTRRNIAKAKITPEKLKALTAFVPGENAYLGGRYAWQSAVLAYIAKQIEEQGFDSVSYGSYLESEDVVSWLSKLFDIKPPFHEAEKIALWKYLKHLETLGLLQQRKTFFEILILPKDYQINWKPKKFVQ